MNEFKNIRAYTFIVVLTSEVASWQTSKVEVIPVYEDFNRRGTSYILAGFWNVQTDSGIKISEIKDEICGNLSVTVIKK